MQCKLQNVVYRSFLGEVSKFMTKRVIGVAVSLTAVLAGCGTTSQAAKPQTSGSSTMSSTPASKSSVASSVTVAELNTNKTAQMVQAGQEATFVVTATTASGQPAANQPVIVYIGPMVPLGAGVSQWYSTSAQTASPYVASYSKTTNSMGQATIVLRGQPTKTMEMIGIKVGSLSTFNPSSMKGAGLMDAWWTTSTTNPTAPVGDYVVVQPFARVVAARSSQPLTITVMSPSGPVSGASVSVTPKTPGASSSMGGSSMSSSGGTHLTTNSQGQVSYTAKAGASMTALPVRIVVSQGMGRIAGGLNADLMAQ